MTAFDDVLGDNSWHKGDEFSGADPATEALRAALIRTEPLRPRLVAERDSRHNSERERAADRDRAIDDERLPLVIRAGARIGRPHAKPQQAKRAAPHGLRIETQDRRPLVPVAVIVDQLNNETDALPQILRTVARKSRRPGFVVRFGLDGWLRGRSDRSARADGSVRALAGVCLVTGLGLSIWAVQMAARDQATAARGAGELTAARLVVDAGHSAGATVGHGLMPLSVRYSDDGPVVHNPDVPVARILSVAERFIAERDVLAARAMLEDLVGREQPHGLYAMAETFDPNMLRSWGVVDVTANAVRARALYQAALNRGYLDAAGRLAALAGQ